MLFDLHYHANIYRLGSGSLRKRMKMHRFFIEKSGIDYLASTEHIYKDPLAAYLYLADAAANSSTRVLPAMEALSAEGIDMIFLYPDEAALRSAARLYPPYRWRIEDTRRIAADSGGVVIVPHPRTPGQTGAANRLSDRRYQILLAQADYVEIHNGSSLSLRKLLGGKYLQRGVPQAMRQKIEQTFDLPGQHRGDHALGWAVGSDAHFPREQVYVGATDENLQAGETAFEFLRDRRIRFSLHQINPYHKTLGSLLRNGHCVFSEAMLKKLCYLRQSLQISSYFPL
jgi:hypothetical protein